MRRIATIAALAAPGLLAAGVSAPAALAADDCPNAAVRSQQGVRHLPNCMAYEKVTPANKGGETPGMIQITEDGGGITFMLNAGIEDAPSFVAARYRSLRSADGRWTTNALMPAMDGPVLPSVLNAASDPEAVTADLSRMVFTIGYGVDPNDQGIANAVSNAGTKDQYLREPDGTFRWLVPDPSAVDTSTFNVTFAAASHDLQRVLVGTKRPWDPRATSASEQLYLWTDGGTHLVSELPDGSLATAIPTDSYGIDKSRLRASADARRVAFLDNPGGDTKLYVRFDADDPAAAFTREVAVGPNGEECSGPVLKALSADGSQVAFDCRTATLPGGLAPGLYVRDLDGGPSAIRRVGDIGAEVVATDDFSRLYVTGVDGSGAAYLVRDGGAPQPVATPVSGTQIDPPEMSDDGEYVVFASSSDFGLPGVNRVQPNGRQIYRYSARSGELTCVSCRPDGAPTDGVASFDPVDLGADTGGGGAAKSGMRPVGTDGAVVFSSTSALVPADTNGKVDAYAWIDGRAVLLSGGQQSLAAVAQGASSDGSSLFFRTTTSLVPDDRDGGQYDLYVARVNGGTLVDEPAAPCRTNCQGPGPQRPGLPNVGTSAFVGPGNLVEQATTPGKASAALTVARTVRGTRTTVRVKVSRAGSVRVSGVGLRRATLKAKKAGTYRVAVRLSSHGAKQQRKRGRLATRVTARFTPESGAPVSARKAVTFTATKKGGR